MIPVLLITNKTDVTTDFVVKKLKESKVGFYRLNTEDIGEIIDVNFDFTTGNFTLFDKLLQIRIDLLKIKSVYFRRPELPAIQKDLSDGENQFLRNEISYTLEGIYKILGDVFWFNNVNNIRNAENKIYQLLQAKKLGFKLPASLITNVKDSAISFYKENDADCIIKPIRTGLITDDKHGEAVIFTNRVYLNDENAQRVNRCPTFFQNHIKKNGDLRITVVGNEVFSVLIHSQDNEDSKVDWRVNQSGLRHSIHILPHEIKSKCISLVRSLDLNFGAIDLILTEKNEYIFLEINPNGQWAWMEKLLDINISGAIADMLTVK